MYFLIFCSLIVLMTESEKLVSGYKCGFVCFSFSFDQLLASIFLNLIHIHDCYIFSMNWILYHYALPHFIFSKSPHSEVYFNGINSPSLTLISFGIWRFDPFNLKLLTFLIIHKRVWNAVLGCNLKMTELSLFISKANHSISR